MRVEDSLHLCWIDVDAARDDHVDLAIADEVIALIVAIRHIAHREEAVVKALTGGLGSVVVLGQPRVANHELAWFAVAGLAAVWSNEPDLLPGHRGPARTWLAQLVLRPQDGVDAGLGRPVELPEHLPEHGLSTNLERVGARRGTQDQRAQRGDIPRPAHLRVDQALKQRRRHERRRDAVTLDEVERSVGLELRLDDIGSAEHLMKRGEEGDRAVISGPADQMDV